MAHTHDDVQISPINTGVLINKIVSPCVRCTRRWHPKDECMDDCKSLDRLRRYLMAYERYTHGCMAQPSDIFKLDTNFAF